MQTHLFCYGTLQIPAVMEAVVGHRPQALEAWLPGYAAYRVRGAEYPGVIKAPGQTTPGKLYRALSADDLQTLDRFEGPLYDRRRARVRLPNGRRCQAWVYTVSVSKTACLSRQSWQVDAFRRTLQKRFMRRFVWARRTVFQPAAPAADTSPEDQLAIPQSRLTIPSA